MTTTENSERKQDKSLVPQLKKQWMKLSPETRMTWILRGYGMYSLPLLAFCWPEVLELTQQKSQLKLPLNYRTQNHLKVMYFGALSMGAEAAIAIHIVDEIQNTGLPIKFLFKDFSAEFMKRAEGDVVFACDDGEKIRAMVRKALETKERQSETFHSFAFVQKISATEPVAKFSLTLSIKI